MYIAVGGNTNAGAPSTFFANLAEVYLSASVLRIKPAGLLGKTLPLDMTNVRGAADLTPFAGTFELFATGHRNPYDLVWHTNGRLYLNGNAPNLNQGNTPGPADGCAATPSIDVSTQPDTLNIVTKGAYGGHPNPIRGECVWGSGRPYSPDLAPDPKWVPPIYQYPSGAPSADGLTEYRSSAFNGQMKGNLISATYAGDQNVRRIALTADGSGVASVTTLGQFTNPLDVAADTNGIIYVAEYGTNQLTLLVPTQLAACPVPGSDPTATDSDKDGYTDYDERANGTDACSQASTPSDFNSNHVSDLLDPDDDSDGIGDRTDQLYLDANNGSATANTLALEWNPSDPAYGGVEHTGFTGIQISSHGLVDQGSGHALVRGDIHPGDAGGHMTLWTEAGTAQGTANTQANALQVGFSSATDFRIWSRITQPFTGVVPAAGHVGGIFFGPNEDNYARVALIGTSGGGRALQFAVETAGTFSEVARVAVSGALNNVDVFLVGRPGASTMTVYYDVNTTGNLTQLGGPVTVPTSWFGGNVGTAANKSLAGVMVSHGAAQQMAFVYDFFRIDRVVP